MTKETFQRFLAVQKSGITNMFDINVVCSAAMLTKAEYFDIIENYDKYEKEFSDDKHE